MPTLLEMRNRVRVHADQRTNDETNSFISKTEMNTLLNAELSSLHDELILAYAEEYVVKTYSTEILQLKSEYELPTDFYRLVNVRIFQGTNDLHSPDPWHFNDLPDLEMQELRGGGRCIRDIFCRLQENRLVLKPSPNNTSAWSLFVVYIPKFKPLVEDTDPYHGINGWEEWAILRTAMKCKAAEDGDVSTLQGLWGLEDAKIQKLKATRNQAKPRAVQDVRGASEYRTRWRTRRTVL